MSATLVGCFVAAAGIRDMFSVCQGCPCAGRHLLFFAAAKKSRQKKAGSHRQPEFLPTGPQRPHPSFGNAPIPLRCRRSEYAPHPLQTPIQRPASSNRFRPLRPTVCWLSHRIRRRTECFLARTPHFAARKPTHSLPQMGHGGSTVFAGQRVQAWVRPSFEAIATEACSSLPCEAWGR